MKIRLESDPTREVDTIAGMGYEHKFIMYLGRDEETAAWSWEAYCREDRYRPDFSKHLGDSSEEILSLQDLPIDLVEVAKAIVPTLDDSMREEIYG